LRGVNVFPTQIEEQLLRVDGLSPHYQIVLSRNRRLDEMTIKVEAATDSISAQERSALAGELAKNIKGIVGVSANIDVGQPGDIDRSAGKAVRVIDARQKE
jgi:phenylacetate-CoA ligase